MSRETLDIVFLVGLGTACAIRFCYVRRSRRRGAVQCVAVPFEWPFMVLVASGMFFLPLTYVFGPWLEFADYGLPAWTGPVGTALFAAALWLLWRSHADLRHNWSAELRVAEGHALVTHGAYRRIRHPMYAAHLLWALAQPLLLHNWLAGPLFLTAFIPICLRRIPREERMMLEHFGDEYRDYMARTGRIIPPLPRRRGPRSR